MNSLDYYNRQKEVWLEKELQSVKYEYEVKQMTISEIGDIHHRTPGCISSKLRLLGLINSNTEARGYLDYRNSDLYKEIVNSGKRRTRSEKKQNRNTPKEISFVLSSNEVNKMQNDIEQLKKDVKEILHLMNAVYDFETQ